MSSLHLSDLAVATGGELFGDAEFTSISTDTRAIAKGDLFVALSGDNFNGNRFVSAAANAGASAALVDQPVETEIPHLQVKDARIAFGELAKVNRRKFSGPLIALTGSAGKTTTKEMIASILSQLAPVLSTQGNFNNEIGVPKTLLNIAPEHRFAVIEMGASKAGDIAYLTQFAEPSISILTNAMAVHIEGFGSVEVVAKTKGEIFSCLPASGTAVINLDDPFHAQWQQQAGDAAVIYFSQSNSTADIYSSGITVTASGASLFTLHSSIANAVGQLEIKLPLLGRHNIANALAAAAGAIAAGASLAQVKSGLESIQPVNGRLKSIPLNNQLLIDDSYNASPGSVKAAIDVLAGFSGDRCLVLGTMGELGAQAEQGHLEVAAYACEKGIEHFFAVGEYAALMVGVFGGGLAYNDMAELLGDVEKIATVETVLVKGSRSARMERVVEALINNNGGQQ